MCIYAFMGRLNILLPDDLEQQFRREVATRMGLKKGNLGIAIEEAIKLWIKRKP